MITSVTFFIALLLGLPIFITLLLGTLVFLWQTDLTVLMSSLPIQLYGSLNQNGLLAIPLFMLVGELMNKGGLTSRLMDAADVFVGGFKGGLAYVNLLTNAMAASILGSATAQIAVMSRLMVPTMVEKGYKKEFSAAVTMAGGLLGPIIPPSMLMIIYGVVAYQPISALFIAGILPGLLIIAGFALVIFLTGLFAGLPSGEHLKHKNIRRELVNGLLPGTIPLVVIVCIISGVMTPTEAGAIASIMAFLIGAFVYKTINLKELPEVFASVAVNTATITGLIATASVFGWALSFEAVPDMLVEWISGITTSPLLFLMLVYVLVILLGMFLESISVMIVIVPIILPAAVSFGIDPIHFGVIISLATLIGLVTPPVGPGLYIAMTSANLPMGALFKAMIPFLVSMLVCMLIIAVFPAISLWLPSLL
ncbi:putative TRAP-type C4-dicarboxylate transport system large permease [Oceanimonas sp. GK1]|uniref:TRAP transporter large permease n=1 Tax=Oceanimonas sp. (strain GK1 / IBRC-M 10197) TaxID=511062 RepID=UPI0002494C13|nr:TRAP transporter large permease [Oceanimonas sp. GK1]AEY00363.1 putative TRAP-type C4-dicarboxylate transport system large permease [Oceanimonas sp. GK1]